MNVGYVKHRPVHDIKHLVFFCVPFEINLKKKKSVLINVYVFAWPCVSLFVIRLYSALIVAFS